MNLKQGNDPKAYAGNTKPQTGFLHAWKVQQNQLKWKSFSLIGRDYGPSCVYLGAAFPQWD